MGEDNKALTSFSQYLFSRSKRIFISSLSSSLSSIAISSDMSSLCNFLIASSRSSLKVSSCACSFLSAIITSGFKVIIKGIHKYLGGQISWIDFRYFTGPSRFKEAYEEECKQWHKHEPDLNTNHPQKAP